jgi:hypothetical protein
MKRKKDIGDVKRLAVARFEHGHWRFIRMQYRFSEQLFAQCPH